MTSRYYHEKQCECTKFKTRMSAFCKYKFRRYCFSTKYFNFKPKIGNILVEIFSQLSLFGPHQSAFSLLTARFWKKNKSGILWIPTSLWSKVH